LGLSNNQPYFYRLIAINNIDVKATPSRILQGTPFNTKPIAKVLQNVYLPNQGRKLFNNYLFTSVGSVDTDGVIDSVVWYVNGRRITNTSILSYDFRQGSSLVTLKVYDNDLAVDTSYAYIHISTWQKSMNSPVSAGLSARNENMIYVADERSTGAKMFQLDSLGAEKFSLGVDFAIKTTPSIKHDSAVFITNGNGLNAFNKLGSSLFPRKDLGGLVLVTPTIDSTLDRIYMGIESNSNFFALNSSNSSQEWVYQCKAPIQSSAVLTADRKLIFPDIAGNLYGFDVSTSSSQGTPASPKWEYQILDSVNTSPAIDNNGKIFVGTRSGKLKKLSFETNGTVNEIWSQNLGSTVSNSPVIDANGFIYIGCVNGNFHKIHPSNGQIVWTYQTGAAIRSTPAISGKGKIYIANEAGLLSVIDTSRNEYWFYKDSTAINANILHIKGTTYLGTMGGKVLAFWDQDLPYNRKKAEPEKEPMWGTFQGNAQRTGAQTNDTSATVGLDKSVEALDQTILIYPNPNEGQFYIDCRKGTLLELIIMDGQGKTVYTSKEVQLNEPIQIDQLNAGVYMCLIKTDKGNYHQKMLINK
jgi:outer membrane protein assembly factor BamB